MRESDGVELVAQSLYRHLPVLAMLCARDPDHLATVYCDTCGQRLCQSCWGAYHSGHPPHPYRYLDWSARPPQGITGELGELIGDAARALQAGLEEIMPRTTPRRHGVVFSDADAPLGDDPEGPVRKLERWLGRT